MERKWNLVYADIKRFGNIQIFSQFRKWNNSNSSLESWWHNGILFPYCKRKKLPYDKEQSINMSQFGCIWQDCVSKLHTGKSKVSSLHRGALQNHLYALTIWFMQNMRFSILWHITCILFCLIVSPRWCRMRLILRCSLEWTSQTQKHV